MNNPPKNSPATSPSPKRKRSPSPSHSAQDKAQAVLAVWTERCKPADVCRQMGVRYPSLHQWQLRAMEGMLQALENRVNLKEGRALSPKLQALLARQSRGELSSRLQSKLEQAQSKLANAADKAA